MPQNQCARIFQDSKRYIWIATKGGLSRFDGIKFKNYTTDDGLIGNFGLSISEDCNGNIWYLSAYGFSVITQNDSVITYKSNEFIGDCNSLYRSCDSIFIFVFNISIEKFCLYLFENNKFTDLSTIFPEIKQATKLGVFKTNDNEIILKIDKFYKLKNNKLEFFLDEPDLEILLQNPKGDYILRKWLNDSVSIYSYSEDKLKLLFNFKQEALYPVVKSRKNGNLIFHNDLKIFEYDYETGEIKKLTDVENYVNDILIDSEDNIWLANEFGLYKITPFTIFDKSSGVPDYVWSVLEDNAGNMWFGSYSDMSLTVYDGNKFETKFKAFNNWFYMGACKTKSGELVFPDATGAFVYDNKSLFKKYLKGCVLIAYEDTIKNNILYGTNIGLIIEKMHNGKISKEINPEDTIFYQHFRSSDKGNVLGITQTKEGDYWFVTGRNLVEFDGQTFNYISKDSIIGSAGIYCIQCDYNNNLWFGGITGLYFYDYKDFYKINHPELNSMIGSICKIDSSHYIYGGVNGVGIIDLQKFYDYKTSRKFQTSKKLDATNFVTFYDKSQGFSGIEVGQNGVFCDSKQQIWIPTSENVVMLDYKQLTDNIYPPKLNLEKATFNDSIIVYDFQNIPEIKNKIKNFRIDFVGINMKAHDRVFYSYKLDGFDNDWSDLTNQSFVNYSNLLHGKYKFHIKAQNSEGIWSDEKTFEFRIKPAFYQTLFAQIALYSIVIIVTVLVTLRYLKKRREKLERESQLKESMYKNSINRNFQHFLFNSISAIASTFYLHDKETAYQYFIRTSDIIRELMKDSSRKYRTIKQEIDFIDNYLHLQKFRFPKKFDFKIECNIQNDKILIPPFLIQTFVENAFQHGIEPLKENGFIEINLSQINEKITIIVDDNGIGRVNSRKNNYKNSGNGLKFLDKFLEIFSKTNSAKISYEIIDKYENSKPMGTLIILTIKQKLK